MKLIHKLTEPPWRTIIVCAGVIVVFLVGYQLWTPGKLFTDGRHDVKSNGIWLQHGWLGDDKWFQQYKKTPHHFRNPQNILQLKKLLVEHNIVDLYPHLCPCHPTGEIAAVDPQQVRQFFGNYANRSHQGKSFQLPPIHRRQSISKPQEYIGIERITRKSLKKSIKWSL